MLIAVCAVSCLEQMLMPHCFSCFIITDYKSNKLEVTLVTLKHMTLFFA